MYMFRHVQCTVLHAWNTFQRALSIHLLFISWARGKHLWKACCRKITSALSFLRAGLHSSPRCHSHIRVQHEYHGQPHHGSSIWLYAACGNVVDRNWSTHNYHKVNRHRIRTRCATPHLQYIVGSTSLKPKSIISPNILRSNQPAIDHSNI